MSPDAGSAGPAALRRKRDGIPGLRPGGTVAIVGLGLTGSALAELALEPETAVLVDPDRLEAGSRLAPGLAGGSAGELKVAVVARRRERFSWARTVAVPLAVEELGGGFWRWLAGQGGLVFDATDRGATHAWLGAQAKRYGLPLVQMGVWGWEAAARYFPADRGAACWQCLGAAAEPARRSCLSGAVEVNARPAAAPATRSHPAAAAAAAALALGLVAQGEQLSPGAQERRLDLRSGRGLAASLPRSPRCRHARAPREALRLAAGSEAPLAVAFAVAEERLGGEVELVLTGQAALEMACLECGARLPGPRLVGGREWACPDCGGRRLVADRAGLRGNISRPQLTGITAAELGLPQWAELSFRLRGTRKRLALLLDGDAAAICGTGGARS